MELPRQEFWSGFPFPSPGVLPNPGIKPGSPALKADSLPSEPLGNAGIREMWASLVAQMVKNLLAVQAGFDSWVRKIPWRREWLPIPEFFLQNFMDRGPDGLHSPWGQKQSDMTERLSN